MLRCFYVLIRTFVTKYESIVCMPRKFNAKRLKLDIPATSLAVTIPLLIILVLYYHILSSAAF
jgi:hypothetical protein